MFASMVAHLLICLAGQNFVRLLSELWLRSLAGGDSSPKLPGGGRERGRLGAAVPALPDIMRPVLNRAFSPHIFHYRQPHFISTAALAGFSPVGKGGGYVEPFQRLLGPATNC